MNKIKNFLSNIQLLEPISSKNGHEITIIPLALNSEPKINYISLAEAIKTGNFEIKESSAEGIVQTISAVNNTHDYVLIVEGEELIGAKQNRIINTTILLKPQSITNIPVSCIEQGRWRFTTEKFRPRERIVDYELRKKTHETVYFNLKASGSYRSDQSEIWNTISKKFFREKINSPTQSYSDFLDEYTDRYNIDNLIDYFDREFVRKYECNGLAVLINSQVKMIEYFSSKRFFKNFALNLIKGLVINYSEISKKSPVIFDNVIELKKFLNLIMENETNFEKYKPIGIGEEYRFSNHNLKLNASSLVFENELIHFVAYNG